MEPSELKDRLGGAALNIILSGLGTPPKQKGKSIFTICPYHGDTDPSFSWYEEANMFKCMVCD